MPAVYAQSAPSRNYSLAPAVICVAYCSLSPRRGRSSRVAVQSEQAP